MQCLNKWEVCVVTRGYTTFLQHTLGWYVTSQNLATYPANLLCSTATHLVTAIDAQPINTVAYVTSIAVYVVAVRLASQLLPRRAYGCPCDCKLLLTDA